MGGAVGVGVLFLFWLVPVTFRRAVHAAQLRNPLHAMMGALTMFETGVGGTRADVYRTLQAGLTVMNDITGDFLDIHALSLGNLVLRGVWTNLRELLLE